MARIRELAKSQGLAWDNNWFFEIPDNAAAYRSGEQNGSGDRKRAECVELSGNKSVMSRECVAKS